MTQKLHRIVLGILATGFVVLSPVTQAAEVSAPQIDAIAQGNDFAVASAQTIDQSAETIEKSRAAFVEANVAVQQSIKEYISSLDEFSKADFNRKTEMVNTVSYEPVNSAMKKITQSVSELEKSIPDEYKADENGFSRHVENIGEAVQAIEDKKIVPDDGDTTDDDTVSGSNTSQPAPGLTAEYIKAIQGAFDGLSIDGDYGTSAHSEVEKFLIEQANTISASSGAIDTAAKEIIERVKSAALDRDKKGQKDAELSSGNEFWQGEWVWMLPTIIILAIAGFLGFQLSRSSRSESSRYRLSSIQRRQRRQPFSILSFLGLYSDAKSSDDRSPEPSQTQDFSFEDKRELEDEIERQELAYKKLSKKNETLIKKNETLIKKNEELNDELRQAQAQIRTISARANTLTQNSSSRRKITGEKTKTSPPPSRKTVSPHTAPASQIIQAYNSNSQALKRQSVATVTETKQSQGDRRVGKSTVPVLIEDSAGNYWVLKDATGCYLVPKPSARFNKYSSELLEALYEIQGGTTSHARKIQLLSPAVVSAISRNVWQVLEKGIITFG